LCLIFALCLLPTFVRLMGGFAEFPAGGSRDFACFLRYGMCGLAHFPRGGISVLFALASRFI